MATFDGIQARPVILNPTGPTRQPWNLVYVQV
ncbi:hypothetical protein CCACVL1_09588 [Corchorus capsularis]|uniref:Uncharacterized protein n=1 Tax=Corchorus capsularis TaxID=210143 RepID=A0A1R3IV76_COCAP|nr:hypothetical protein CCACVL1_09588 [Corchorus capsularis]